MHPNDIFPEQFGDLFSVLIFWISGFSEGDVCPDRFKAQHANQMRGKCHVAPEIDVIYQRPAFTFITDVGGSHRLLFVTGRFQK